MMQSRREFIKQSAISATAGAGVLYTLGCVKSENQFELSAFGRSLKPVGRILEIEDFYVWCNTPLYDADGRVHVFFSQWKAEYGMGGWIHKCEIAHAVAASPESEFIVLGPVISPRPGFFDATTCHNPHIQFIDGTYCLFYMGNSNGKTNTKRIGLATAPSLYGPWLRRDTPLLETGEPGAWDDHCTTNPAFLKHPNGEYWLYYKSWNTAEYENPVDPQIRGNRKYGLAIASQLDGPYVKHPDNPVIDFSAHGNNQQLEDAFVWHEDDMVKLIARDMGFYNHEVGLYFESPDGLNWQAPQIAYREVSFYVDEPPAPKHLKRYGRFERPQLLLKDGKPTHLFTTSQGGKYMTASGFVFQIT